MKAMNKFSAKNISVLSILLLISLIGLFAVENSKVEVKQKWYSDKLRAAILAEDAAAYIKNFRLKNSVFIDAVNDPNETALIGQEFTLITTDRGKIESKLSTTNPNFAAIIVDMFLEAGLRKNDVIAIGYTGSFPGLNIAVLAAVEEIGLKPLIITSVGASNFGANDPYFTWLDMEKFLYNKGVFSNRSLAASIGGGVDIGRGLSPEGRKLIINAIKRNDVEFINEKYLEKSIESRMNLYNKYADGREIKAYVNVGGGIASLGATVNGKIIRSGLSEVLDLQNYPVRGVIIQMALKKIPVIHLLNISKLLQQYGLPNSPVPLPDPGEGEIFTQQKYNVTLTFFVALLLAAVLIAVYIIDKKRHQLGTEFIPIKMTEKKPEVKLTSVSKAS